MSRWVVVSNSYTLAFALFSHGGNHWTISQVISPLAFTKVTHLGHLAYQPLQLEHLRLEGERLYVTGPLTDVKTRTSAERP